MLFATLDTSVRNITPKGQRPFLLSDTVGFISQLPHSLVKAFRSTIEEVKYADLILEVVDFSDPEYRWHMDVTRDTFAEIGVQDIPIVYVFNKADIVRNEQLEEGRLPLEIPKAVGDRIYICAKDGECLQTLVDFIEQKLFEDHRLCELLLPYSESAVLADMQGRGLVQETEYLPEGIRVSALLDQRDSGRLMGYFT